VPGKSKYDIGHTFYEKEVKPYMSSPDEKWLETISAEIVILSKDVKKKYFWVNISFLAVIAALIFMALIVGAGYFVMRPT
jgi:hypothetical protein